MCTNKILLQDLTGRGDRMYSKYVKLIWEVQPKDTELKGRETFTSDLGMKTGSLTGVGLSKVGTRAR